MGRFSWVLSFTFGCGARTALDVPEVRDAAAPPADVSAPQPLVPCTARDYDVTGDFPQTSFAVAGGYIYVISKTTYDVVRVGTDDATLETVTPSDNGEASSFVVDDAYVWWARSDPNEIFRAPITGGQKQQLACAGTCPAKPGAVGITTSALILSDQSNTLYAMSKVDGTLTPFFKQNKPTAPVADLVATGTHVFWTTDEYVFDAVAGDVTPNIDDNWPSGLAGHADDVYWTSLTNGTNHLVHRAVSGGATNVVFTGELKGPLGANAQYVYGLTGGGIARVSVTTGESTLIAPYVFPSRMVIDGMCIYTLEKNGRVRRMPG